MTTPVVITESGAPVQVTISPNRSVSVVVLPQPTITVQISGARGPQGLPGASGASLTFDFPSASATWTVAHNLGRNPIVQLVGSDLAVFDSDVEFPDLDTVVVTHAFPITGSVVLS